MSDVLRKNRLDRQAIYQKVAKWEAKQAEKQKKMEEELKRIAVKKNENAFVELFREIKKYILC